MTTCSWAIAGGDYERGGSATRCLKEMLKSLGVGADALRRVMVAAYEAEMNVVIHARAGTLLAAVDGDRVVVRVDDEGPGIADLGLAMQPGYSTAPARARELGFGAGLGLPNIRRHSDDFELRSEPGRGTNLRFAVRYEPDPACARADGSLRLRGERCRQCLRCLGACPTGAMRVHRGVPGVLAHRCIDCTECVAACPDGAVFVEESAPALRDRVLVGHPALLFLRGPRVAPEQVRRALAEAGCAWRDTEPWERGLREAIRGHAEANPNLEFVLSPACAAIGRLVETRFPSLVEHLAPFASPLEAAWRDSSSGDGAAPMLGMLCPAQRSELLAAGVPPERIFSPRELDQALGPRPHAPPTDAGTPPGAALPGEREETLGVSGVRHALRLLEALEDGAPPPARVIELHACERGCFGSGLLPAAIAPLAAEQWRVRSCSGTAGARPRAVPFARRPGLRLDPDMGRAIARLGRIDELARALPGRDCGACGAPSCRAFAEDVVLERVSKKACPHAQGATP